MRRIVPLVSMRHTVLLLAAMIALVLVSGVAPKPADASTRIATKTFSNTAQINFAYGIPGWVNDGATAAWGWPNPVKIVKGVAKAVAETATEVAETVAETATEVVETVAETAEAVGDGIKDGAEAVVEGVKDGAEAGWEAAKEELERLEPELVKVFREAIFNGESVTFWGIVQAAIHDQIHFSLGWKQEIPTVVVKVISGEPVTFEEVACAVNKDAFNAAIPWQGKVADRVGYWLTFGGDSGPGRSCAELIGRHTSTPSSGGAAEQPYRYGGLPSAAEEQTTLGDAAEQPSSDDTVEQPSADGAAQQPTSDGAAQQLSSDDTAEQPSAAEEQTTSGGAVEQPNAAEEQYQSQ